MSWNWKKLQKIIAEVLNVDEAEVTMDTTFVDDLGADSLDVFQIMMGIEEEFDIEDSHRRCRADCFLWEIAVEQIKKLVG